jgi:hypothetical protein
MRWFKSSGQLERDLFVAMREAYRQFGHSDKDAKQIATDTIERAKAIVAAGGFRRDPPNLGDWALQHERSDPRLKARLDALRADGVTDEDIRWWWNMKPLECAVKSEHEKILRMASFLAIRSQGLSAEAAEARVWKGHANFGDTDPSGTCEDRPLPPELLNRITRYIEKQRQAGDFDAWREKMDAATSFNALVRAEIRKGNL